MGILQICAPHLSKKRYQKDMFLKEIELCAHNVLTNPGSIVNIIGGAYVPFLWLTVSGL